MSIERDFVGYGANPPVFDWPGGNRLAINLVVNYEEGSEYAYSHGDDRQENSGEWGPKAFPDGVRNLANESFFEYGSRVGFWRLLHLFERHGIRVTFGVCPVALEKNPTAAAAIVAAGHEVNAHGYRWEEHFRMDPDTERERIRLAVDAIERLTGERPYGWYCRTAPSENTRRLLVEEGGFVYDSDAYNDDLPYFVEVDGERHVVVPYTGDVNDSHIWLSNGYETDFVTYLKNSFDVLYEESRRFPRMMSVGLHMRMAGRPGRIKAVDEFLRYARERDGVWFASRLEIANAFIAAMDDAS
ncbi:MAG TPA: polysaccharide deacetylase family protein [Natronoarchaeum rubrum]|nr:polysaccharide deacetylase family protein [Natronoarchaeum rubrum]